jgi:hypothetical protein
LQIFLFKECEINRIPAVHINSLSLRYDRKITGTK